MTFDAGTLTNSANAPSPWSPRIRVREQIWPLPERQDRKSTRLNSSHLVISYAVFCLNKTTIPTAYDVSPLAGRHDVGYYTVKDCDTIYVLPRTRCNNASVGIMAWSHFTAPKWRGLV